MLFSSLRAMILSKVCVRQCGLKQNKMHKYDWQQLRIVRQSYVVNWEQKCDCACSITPRQESSDAGVMLELRSLHCNMEWIGTTISQRFHDNIR